MNVRWRVRFKNPSADSVSGWEENAFVLANGVSKRGVQQVNDINLGFNRAIIGKGDNVCKNVSYVARFDAHLKKPGSELGIKPNL